MRNVSVKEAAEALGVTPRTIQYKLQNGELKGTRVRNQYGKDEWKIYPTKQIAEALSLKAQSGDEFPPLESSVVEAEEISGDEFSESTTWRERELERLEMMAEKLVKPLADRIEVQAALIQDQERTIAEQKRQLRLLPDLEARAESERKASELKELESEALRKQVSALQAERGAAERAALESQRVAQEEIEQLKREKEEQARAVQQQLETLSATVQQLQVPWWKKMFMPREV